MLFINLGINQLYRDAFWNSWIGRTVMKFRKNPSTQQDILVDTDDINTADDDVVEAELFTPTSRQNL